MQQRSQAYCFFGLSLCVATAWASDVSDWSECDKTIRESRSVLIVGLDSLAARDDVMIAAREYDEVVEVLDVEVLKLEHCFDIALERDKQTGKLLASQDEVGSLIDELGILRRLRNALKSAADGVRAGLLGSQFYRLGRWRQNFEDYKAHINTDHQPP